MSADDQPARQALEQMVDLLGEATARQILRETGRPAALAEFERIITRRLAFRLLADQAPRSHIRDRLVSRGLSTRTAYRMIDAALGFGPRSCATYAGPLAHDLRTLGASSMEHIMNVQEIRTSAIKQLEAEHGQLATAVARAADWVRATTQQLHDAETNKGRVYGGTRITLENREDARVIKDQQDAAHAVTNARYDQSRATFQWNGLLKKRERHAHLGKLLAAPETLKAALASATAATEMLDISTKAVADAQAAHSTIVAMLDQAEADFEQARSHAASDVLATVKAGGDPTKVQAASRDKIATLDMARSTAEQELHAAQAAQQAAAGKRKSAMSQLQEAHVAVDQLNELVIEQAMATAAAKARAEAALTFGSSPDYIEAQTLLAGGTLSASQPSVAE